MNTLEDLRYKFFHVATAIAMTVYFENMTKNID